MASVDVSVDEFTRDVFRRLTDALERAARRVQDDEPDSIHSMRTTVRRVRSVLRSLGPVLKPSVTRDLRVRLALVGDVLGHARDREVAAATAESMLEGIPEQWGKAAARERLVDSVRREFVVAASEARDYLTGTEYEAVVARLEAFAIVPPLDSAVTASGAEPFDAPAAMNKIVRKQARRTIKRWKRARSTGESSQLLDELHDARKAAKRVRYTAEAFDATGLLETSYVQIAEAAEQIQDQLGTHRDMLLYAEQLLVEAEHAHAATENTFVYGVMHERLVAAASGGLRDVPSGVRALRRAKKAL